MSFSDTQIWADQKVNRRVLQDMNYGIMPILLLSKIMELQISTYSPRSAIMENSDLVYFSMLNFIAKRSGTVSWYNVEIHLGGKGLGGLCNIYQLAESMKNDGVIDISPGSERPSQQLYTITEHGLKVLAENPDFEKQRNNQHS